MVLGMKLVFRCMSAARSALASGLLLVLAGCAPPADLAITNVTVIDPGSGGVESAQTVLVSGGLIRSVAATSADTSPSATITIDGTGKYLIPGLWDMHTHLGMHTDTDLAMLVANGVLNVRDMGGDPFLMADLKERIGTGELVGPTIRGAGAILEDRRWLTRARKTFPGLEHRVPVDNPEEARATVAMVKSWGADLIKVRNLTDKATLGAILTAAKAEGLTVAGHEPIIVDIDEAATLGMTTFEHIPFISLTMPGKEADAERLAAAIETIRRSGAYLVPTLLASNGLGVSREDRAAWIARPDERYEYLPASVREQWEESLDSDPGPLPWGAMRDRSLEMLLEMHQAGIPILAGTDMGVPLTFPGSSLHDELELLVDQVGLTPMAALVAATSAPASLFKAADGAVAPGMAANLILLDANPLESIGKTRDIRAVVVRGELFDRDRLDSLLEHVRENKDNESGPSLFEQLESACRAGETAECLEELAGYQFSKARYVDARSTYQEAIDAGAGKTALEGLFSSTVNVLFEGGLDCSEVAGPVEALLQSNAGDADKAVGVLGRILPTLVAEAGGLALGELPQVGRFLRGTFRSEGR